MQFTFAIDWLLSRFAFVAIPIFVVVSSVALVLFQGPQYPDGESESLAFKVLADPQEALTADIAGPLLEQQEPLIQYDTGRATHRFWLWIPLPEKALHNYAVEFPSRHLQLISCRDAESQRPLGSADRSVSSGILSPAKAGFAAHFTRVRSAPTAMLCQARFSGPAQISARTLLTEHLLDSEHRFDVSSGLLQGGMLTLALFTLVMAAINRESRYVLLTIWLFCNLRLASLTLGSDFQWLGYKIPSELMDPLRQLTIAAYYLVTYLLFCQYFRADLVKLGYGWMLRLFMAGGVVLFACAAVLPFATFLPVMWVIASMGIVISIFLLTVILFHRPSRSAIYFSLAMGFALIAILAEVLAAALGWKFLLTFFNSISAALASSVLVTLALSEQMRREREDRVSAQEALTRTYDSAPIGLFTSDLDGNFVQTNPTMRNILGVSEDRAKWLGIQDWFDNVDIPELRRIAAFSGGGDVELHRSADGLGQSTHWFLTKVVEVDGKIEGSLQNITDRVEATEKLRYLANHDSLTGLLNRRGITLVLENAVQSSGRGKAASLLYVDLNRFKLVNDLYRDQVGDQILKMVAERIKGELPAQSELGRLGSDQYLAVILGLSIDDAHVLAERIVAAVNTVPYRYGQQLLQVEGAMGLVDITGTMTTASAISTAQRACVDAKRGPRALVVYGADASVHQERLEELHLIKLLGGETLPPGLQLYMQPIMSLREPNESLNFEILLRFKDIGGRMVPVNRVLDAAVASGNMARLDKWVLTETLRWLERHHERLHKTRFVSVNLSGTSLNDQAFLEDVINILQHHQSVVHYVCFEITEGVALNDLIYTNLFIERLKECGASIALDDFGAGYTSFSYLRNLQADALKIDGAFIQSINNHPANVAIVASIVELAHNLGMRSIAEGVEDAAMLEVLSEIGVDYIQGYVVTRPQPLDTAINAVSAASFIGEIGVASLVEKLAEVRRKLEQDAPEDGPLYH